MSKILAVVEQRDGELRGVSREVVSAAARLASETGGEVNALLLGDPGVREAAPELGRHGAKRVRVAAHDALASYNPDGYAEIVRREVEEEGYDVVLLPATMQGKDLAPRVAAMLDVPLAQDIVGMAVVDEVLELLRPVYAGKAFTRISVDASPVLATLRPNVFPVEEREGAAEVVEVAVDADPSTWPTRVVSFEATGGDIPDVAEATVIVSGGRGLRDPENWGVLEDLRSALGNGAGLGASRAVVDAGWRPHGEQVGQTGKTVAPRLYFAIGISGAIQHLAGMRTAGTIVAVNRDPDAPIFKVADYGIVGDLFEVVPRLAEEIRALKAGG
jgi:electron transfer flavoprotein alpha subunit